MHHCGNYLVAEKAHLLQWGICPQVCLLKKFKTNFWRTHELDPNFISAGSVMALYIGGLVASARYPLLWIFFMLLLWLWTVLGFLFSSLVTLVVGEPYDFWPWNEAFQAIQKFMTTPFNNEKLISEAFDWDLHEENCPDGAKEIPLPSPRLAPASFLQTPETSLERRLVSGQGPQK